MHFAVDAHAIGRKLTGNEVYVRNLLSNFAALDQDSTFTAFYGVPEAQGSIPDRFRARPVSANPFLRLGFDLSRELRRDMPDLLHVQYTAPLACPVPVVVSVHDVSYLEHPEYFLSARVQQLRVTVKRTVLKAARILTPSEFSRGRILHHYDVPPERVHTTPLAASPLFRPVDRDVAAARLGQKHSLRHPFILCVGDQQPRKNQEGLIEAFGELVREYPQLPHELVFVGQETWYSRRVYEAAKRSGAAHRIHFIGFAPDDDLVYLYNACEFFVFPSHYEGFGIPILEAMACGRAVACADTSAMPEVASAAAILFNPRSRREIVMALRDLALDQDLRQRMGKMGEQRAAQFTWRSTAVKTLEAYYQVAREAARVPAYAASERAL